MTNRITHSDTNVMALVKGHERYVFIWTDDHRDELLTTLGRFAADKRLGFNWRDAAWLARQMRELEGSTL
jgi:hypothetical protein